MSKDLTRAEICCVLGCMGIDIPPTSQLSDESLEKRLRDALNAAQYKHRFSLPFDFNTFSDWPIAKPGEREVPLERRLLQSVRRGNIAEAARTRATGGKAPQLYVDPFMDLRQTAMSLANHLDKGNKCCVVQDLERKKMAINIRVRQIPSIHLHIH